MVLSVAEELRRSMALAFEEPKLDLRAVLDLVFDVVQKQQVVLSRLRADASEIEAARRADRAFFEGALDEVRRGAEAARAAAVAKAAAAEAAAQADRAVAEARSADARVSVAADLARLRREDLVALERRASERLTATRAALEADLETLRPRAPPATVVVGHLPPDATMETVRDRLAHLDDGVADEEDHLRCEEPSYQEGWGGASQVLHFTSVAGAEAATRELDGALFAPNNNRNNNSNKSSARTVYRATADVVVGSNAWAGARVWAPWERTVLVRHAAGRQAELLDQVEDLHGRAVDATGPLAAWGFLTLRFPTREAALQGASALHGAAFLSSTGAGDDDDDDKRKKKKKKKKKLKAEARLLAAADDVATLARDLESLVPAVHRARFLVVSSISAEATDRELAGALDRCVDCKLLRPFRSKGRGAMTPPAAASSSRAVGVVVVHQEEEEEEEEEAPPAAAAAVDAAAAGSSDDGCFRDFAVGTLEFATEEAAIRALEVIRGGLQVRGAAVMARRFEAAAVELVEKRSDVLEAALRTTRQEEIPAATAILTRRLEAALEAAHKAHGERHDGLASRVDAIQAVAEDAKAGRDEAEGALRKRLEALEARAARAEGERAARPASDDATRKGPPSSSPSSSEAAAIDKEALLRLAHHQMRTELTKLGVLKRVVVVDDDDDGGFAGGGEKKKNDDADDDGSRRPPNKGTWRYEASGELRGAAKRRVDELAARLGRQDGDLAEARRAVDARLSVEQLWSLAKTAVATATDPANKPPSEEEEKEEEEEEEEEVSPPAALPANALAPLVQQLVEVHLKPLRAAVLAQKGELVRPFEKKVAAAEARIDAALAEALAAERDRASRVLAEATMATSQLAARVDVDGAELERLQGDLNKVRDSAAKRLKKPEALTAEVKRLATRLDDLDAAHKDVDRRLAPWTAEVLATLEAKLDPGALDATLRHLQQDLQRTVQDRMATIVNSVAADVERVQIDVLRRTTKEDVLKLVTRALRDVLEKLKMPDDSLMLGALNYRCLGCNQITANLHAMTATKVVHAGLSPVPSTAPPPSTAASSTQQRGLLSSSSSTRLKPLHRQGNFGIPLSR